MEEQLISFETAILAKEKGFNEITISLFDVNGIISSPSGYLTGITKNDYLDRYRGNVCSAITQSLLQKWLREEHNIHTHVTPMHLSEGDWRQQAYLMKEGHYKGSRPAGFHYKSYEEALEDGLIEALKLIK